MNKTNKRNRLRLQAETVRQLSSKDLSTVAGGYQTEVLDCCSMWDSGCPPYTAYTFCITKCGTTGDISNLCTLP